MNHIVSIFAMAVCLAMSAYFSATETAFSSLNKTRLKVLADNGNKRAALALKLAENYDEDICYEVLNRLAEIGCIDDRRYARYLAEKLCTVKKYGYFKAREEMRLKGLSRDIIEEALADYSEDCSERVLELIDKKYARYLTDD